MITITLNQIKAHNPCTDGWRTLLKAPPDQDPDVPFPLANILDTNDLDDTLWCLRCLPDSYDSLLRHLAVDIAASVVHLTDDERVHNALHTVRRYADGNATREELEAAWSAAWSAVEAAQTELLRDYLTLGERPPSSYALEY